MFSCEFSDIFKNIFFTEHIRTTTSEQSKVKSSKFLILNITTSAKFILLTEQNKCSVQLTCRIFIIFVLDFKSSIVHKLKTY